MFKNPQGSHAGKLIEACGLKGTRKGGAVVSEKHANFIMNEGSATSADIRYLIDFVKREVQEKLGVSLEEEVRLIG